ncbi:hypothetical protein ACHAXS_007870 [Conticribra weissflogii]
MFGGLELKGPSKEESAAAAAASPPSVPEATPTPAAPLGGSGFFFLQPSNEGDSNASSETTPKAPSATGITGANDAAKSPTGEPSSAQSAVSSAFGFLSASIGGAPDNATTAAGVTTSTAENGTAVAPPPVAAPSMFAGLNTSSSASLSSAHDAAVAAPPVSAVSSGFSFLSPPAATSAVPAPPSTEASAAIDAAPSSTAGSSFSFMSGMLGGGVGAGESAAEENADVRNQVTASESGETNLSAVEEAKTTAADSTVGVGSGTSGFSFLTGTPSAPPAPPAPADATPGSTTMPVTSAPSWGGLAATPATETSEATTISTAANTNTAPSPAPADADFLSMSNPGLPTGAGVSWSAPPIGSAPTKKVIKKRLGKTRVGIAASASGPMEIPEPSIPSPDDSTNNASSSFIANSNAYIPAPVPEQPYQTPQVPTTPQHHTAPPPPISPTSPPLRVKAEKAMQSADEFIREKQRSAIAMAAERAMHERSVHSIGSAGNSGSSPGTMTPSSSHPSLQMPSANDLASNGSSSGWKLGNPAESAAQFTTSPKDETYQAAKAAAEEARKLSESVPASKGKVSLFSSFFGRGKGNGSGGHGDSISSYSSHGGVVTQLKSNERQESANSLSPTKEEDSSSYMVAAHLQPRPSQPGHDVTSEEERAMQDAYREREMEIEQERMRIAMEQQRKREAEAERKRLEFVAMEAERRRKEEEEAERQRELAEEEAARRRSPREKMQAILDHFADVTRISTDRVTELREQRAKLVKDRTNAEKTERFAAQQISYAEVQQTKAAEAEDFEAADRLATVIDRHAKEREEQAKIVKQIGNAIAELDGEREEASKAVAACFHNVHIKLKELKDEHEHLRDGDGSDVIKRFELTSKRLSTESERLCNDLKHIERDEELVFEEQKELGGQISEESKEFAEKCNEAM